MIGVFVDFTIFYKLFQAVLQDWRGPVLEIGRVFYSNILFFFRFLSLPSYVHTPPSLRWMIGLRLPNKTAMSTGAQLSVWIREEEQWFLWSISCFCFFLRRIGAWNYTSRSEIPLGKFSNCNPILNSTKGLWPLPSSWAALSVSLCRKARGLEGGRKKTGGHNYSICMFSMLYCP